MQNSIILVLVDITKAKKPKLVQIQRWQLCKRRQFSLSLNTSASQLQVVGNLVKL